MYQLLAAFVAAVVSTVSSTLVAPDLSMRTIPVGYFGGKGGKSGPRDAASIAMLAKMRLVMLEKWEGPCWDACVANATAKLPCSPSCNVEGDMLDVLKAVRAINPNVSTALYLNTLLLFPFYGLAQQYIDQGALLMDSRTNAPVELVNDDGMHGVYVPDFGTQQGRDLWLGTVKGWLASGLVDGIFADKWPDQAHGNKSNASEMVVCNHVCGHVTTAKGIAWNQGKLWVRGNVSAMLAVESRDASTFGGLLYGDGCDGCYRKSPRIDGNLVGPWVSRPSSSNSFSVPASHLTRIIIPISDQELAIHPIDEEGRLAGAKCVENGRTNSGDAAPVQLLVRVRWLRGPSPLRWEALHAHVRGRSLHGLHPRRARDIPSHRRAGRHPRQQRLVNRV